MNGQRRDPKKVLKGIKHGRSGYQRGCGCNICLSEERLYQEWFRLKVKGVVTSSFRNWRAGQGKPAAEPVASVTPLHVVKGGRSKVGSSQRDSGIDDEKPEKPERYVIGAIEKAVIEECEGLSMAKDRPGMVAAARNMAHICDNPKQAALHATANRQMTSILNDLRGNSKRKSKGRLASIQRMTNSVGVEAR